MTESNRVTAYRFGDDAAQTEAACATFRLLLLAGLSPWFVWEPTITIPATEVEKLRALQRAEPERFGGC
jgi:hypothetical protein